MSKRRRWVLIVLGTVQLLFAAFFGVSSVGLQSSASFKVVYANAENAFEAMKDDGAIFTDEDQARSRIQEGLLEVPIVAARGMKVASLILGANGLFFIVFGIWPSRKIKSLAGDPGE